MKLDSSTLYDRYNVAVKLRNKLFGGMPKNRELIKTWIASTTGHDDAQTADQTEEALACLAQEAEDKTWCGFPSDATGGLFIWTRQVKAMLRECGTVLGIFAIKRGSKQIMQHGFEVKGANGGERVYLGRKEPDGCDEAAIHVMGPQGPRSALKRTDFVESAELHFEIWILKTHPGEKRHLGQADLERMLTLAQEDGLGASRSQGHGKFDVTDLKKID